MKHPNLNQTSVSIQFQHWLNHWYIILQWQPENKPALIMRANLPLDEARRDRIRKLFDQLAKELG